MTGGAASPGRPLRDSTENKIRGLADTQTPIAGLRCGSNAIRGTPETVKVLIADDNPGMRQMIMRTLTDHVSQFIECADGSEVLAEFARHRPAWVLMDIRMPGMDGLHATRELIRRFPEARVAIVTAYDAPSLRDSARSAGAAAYLMKDDLQDLVALVSGAPSRENNSPLE
jgi:CheY-like chemotaxis protein